MPECDYCDILVNEDHPEKIRVVHAWTERKEWYYEIRRENDARKGGYANADQTMGKNAELQSLMREAQKLYVKPRECAS